MNDVFIIQSVRDNDQGLDLSVRWFYDDTALDDHSIRACDAAVSRTSGHGPMGRIKPGRANENPRSVIFEQRNAMFYLVGLGVSLLGSNAMTLAAGIWVKSLTGSSAAAGLVSVCIYAPSLVGPLGGLVADRTRRRRLLIAINLIMALLMLPLLAVHTADQVWLIDGAMFVYGAGLIVSGPAESALFAVMLPEAARRRFNGWRLSLQETGRLVAPLIGAGLFTVWGGGMVAALDAATFALAAVMTGLMRVVEPAPAPFRSAWRADIAAGFEHLWRSRPLRRMLVAAAIIMAASGLVVAAQYSLVSALGEPPSFLGVLSAALGAGSIAASLLSGPLLSRVGERGLVLCGLGNYALGSLLRVWGSMPGAVLGSVVLGFALPWVFLGVLNLSQRMTPDRMQGRVSAVVGLALFGPQAPMQALGSLAITQVSYRVLYVGTALVALLTALWLARGTKATDAHAS